jgi:hypothetical protein
VTPFTPSGVREARFREDGFFISEGLLDAEEIELLPDIARADHQLARESAGRRDGQGGIVERALRNDLRDDICGAFVRCRRVVATMQRLLGGEVYHLLHRSDQNRSPDPRWALICCDNAARNDPYKESRHPRYSRLETWPDERIKEVGRRQWAELRSLDES